MHALTEETGILAFGAYIPRTRLRRSAIASANGWFNPSLKGLAKGERACAGWDEDVITMAVEAARDCLAGFDRNSLSSICLASTTAPFADRQNAVVVKEALNLSDMISSMDVGGSQRAGVAMLLQSLRAARGGNGPTLCIASDRRKALPASEAEMSQGDAAAAAVVGHGAPVATFLGGGSVSADFVDHFRAAGREFDYEWEARWVRDEGYRKIVPPAVSQALKEAGLEAADIDHFICPLPSASATAQLARGLGIRDHAVHQPLIDRIGHSGTPHALVMLAACLEEAVPGDRILIAAFGSGCDAIVLRRTEVQASTAPRPGVAGWLARGAAHENYMKFLSFNGLVDLERGMRAEMDSKQPLTSLWRNRRSVLGLVGGRDVKTGRVQFPPSDIPVGATDALRAEYEEYPLADKAARVVTYTADHLTYTPDPPSYYGAVEFRSGARMNVEFCDCENGDIDVGRPMRMMFRIKAVDERRGFYRYFWKAAPWIEAFGPSTGD